MHEWLSVLESDISLQHILLRLGLSAALGILVAVVYQSAVRRQNRDSFPLLMTLVLLTMLVCMTTMVIGSSVARAFGLVGALSIVRFRTVVDDTRDTAFVIFAVVVGMAVGAGYYGVCLIGIPLIASVSIMMGSWGIKYSSEQLIHLLEVRLGQHQHPQEILATVFQRHVKQATLVGINSTKQGIAFDLQYRVQLHDAEQAFVFLKELLTLEGVQTVELKRN